MLGGHWVLVWTSCSTQTPGPGPEPLRQGGGPADPRGAMRRCCGLGLAGLGVRAGLPAHLSRWPLSPGPQETRGRLPALLFAVINGSKAPNRLVA